MLAAEYGLSDIGWYTGGGGGFETSGWGGGGGFGWSGADFGFGFTDPYLGLPPTSGGGGGGGGFNLPPITIAFPGGGGGGGGGVAPSLSRTLTQIVDEFEQRLIANLAEWNNGQKTAADAVSVGWSLMNGMVAACSRYGAQGQRSAAERDRRINPTMLRWDWIGYYIDPITGGPSTPPPLPSGAGVLPSTGIGGIDNSTLFLIVAAVAIYLISQK